MAGRGRFASSMIVLALVLGAVTTHAQRPARFGAPIAAGGDHLLYRAPISARLRTAQHRPRLANELGGDRLGFLMTGKVLSDSRAVSEDDGPGRDTLEWGFEHQVR